MSVSTTGVPVPVFALRIILVAAVSLTAGGCADLLRTDKPEKVGDKHQPPSLVDVVEDFQLDDPGDAWTFRTPALWSIAAEGDRRFLKMAGPPERAATPALQLAPECAIYNRYQFRSFNLSVRVRVDSDPTVPGRNACIIFGRRDDTHFYYLHLSNVAGGLNNTLVRVDGETRTSLVPPGQHPPPAVPGPDWHKVDIIRDVDAGTITVYVDAYDPQAKPWIGVKDRTYDWGHVALGSFNDHASFAHLLISGQARTPQ